MKPASRCVRPLAGLLGLLAALAVLSPGRCAAQKVDPARAKALWAKSEELVGERFAAA